MLRQVRSVCFNFVKATSIGTNINHCKSIGNINGIPEPNKPNYNLLSSNKIIGFDNIPVFTTSVIDQKGFPYLGVGEVVAGPTGAAISNALCKALGQRIKILPFTKDNITKELLN